MRNRLIMGSFRYGLMYKQDLSRYDIPDVIGYKLELYKQSDNLECLVDIANLCMLEFVKFSGKKPFIAEDDISHAQII